MTDILDVVPSFQPVERWYEQKCIKEALVSIKPVPLFNFKNIEEPVHPTFLFVFHWTQVQQDPKIYSGKELLAAFEEWWAQYSSQKGLSSSCELKYNLVVGEKNGMPEVKLHDYHAYKVDVVKALCVCEPLGPKKGFAYQRKLRAGIPFLCFKDGLRPESVDITVGVAWNLICGWREQVIPLLHAAVIADKLRTTSLPNADVRALS